MVEEQEENRLNEPGEGSSRQDELDSLRKELAETKAKAEANLAGWQRAQADFTNYKKRAEQDKLETINFANTTLVLRLLPILDDFERAIICLPPDLAAKSWIDGIKLIERKLRTVLEADGLSPIKAAGEPFDPRLHEAVRQAPGKEGIVLEELQKGYKFRDKVIRPSKVVVGNGEEAQTSEAEQGESPV